MAQVGIDASVDYGFPKYVLLNRNGVVVKVFSRYTQFRNAYILNE